MIFSGAGGSACQDGVVGFLARRELLVVETEGGRYLGSVEVEAEALVVRTGFLGRSPVSP